MKILTRNKTFAEFVDAQMETLRVDREDILDSIKKCDMENAKVLQLIARTWPKSRTTGLVSWDERHKISTSPKVIARWRSRARSISKHQNHSQIILTGIYSHYIERWRSAFENNLIVLNGDCFRKQPLQQV